MQIHIAGQFRIKNEDEPIELFALANEGLIVPKRENMEGKLKSRFPKSNKNLQRIVIAASAVLSEIAMLLTYSILNKKTGFTSNEKP